jgi:Ca-activated chloride channel family protein
MLLVHNVGVIMRKIQLALVLTAVAFIWFYPGMGLDSSSVNVNGARGYDWYSLQAPSDASKLTDEGPQAEYDKNNSLSIVDSMGKRSSISIELPPNMWARLKLAPVSDGELKLYAKYPTGSTDLLLSDSAKKGRSYGAWYSAELEGDYEVWYTLDGYKSNSVLFHVTGSLEEENATATPAKAYSGGVPSSGLAYSGGPVLAGAPAASRSIGFSAGGAKDINSFRDNIKNRYLPLPTDITYEGLFYDYYFDTGQSQECKKLFCPSYSYAISKDPFSKDPQYYLSVGPNSGVTNFQRKKLNLVVVLDYSGSMGSPFDQYYYDRFGNQVELKQTEESRTKKIEIADESVVALLNHLKADDRFGMVIFSDSAFVVDPLTSVSDKDLAKLKKHILGIEEAGSTNMESGMKKATRLLNRYQEADQSEYENRIIFLTDAMPNLGETGQDDLSDILKDNAARKVYTTFIGVGVDFNTELVNNITNIQGANYYSVHSAKEFKTRMDEEFDFMVTPLVFDLRLNLNAKGFQIEKVYGSPEADEATGQIMKVNTLFPSKAEEGQVKGGVILVKLKKLSEDGSLALKVRYKDRSGVDDSDEAKVKLEDTEQDFYQNTGIRKAVLLSRYADLLMDWTIDERKALQKGETEVLLPVVTMERGLLVPVMLGEWERQSVPLQVSGPYRKLFSIFGSYFQDERAAIGDDSLQQEEVILDKLSKYEGSGQKDSRSQTDDG